MRIYYRVGMKSKESNSPRRQEALEPRTYGGICCEQWAILTERRGWEEGGDERGGRRREIEGAKPDTVQLVNSLGCREFLSDEVFQLLGKRRGRPSAEMRGVR